MHKLKPKIENINSNKVYILKNNNHIKNIEVKIGVYITLSRHTNYYYIGESSNIDMRQRVSENLKTYEALYFLSINEKLTKKELLYLELLTIYIAKESGYSITNKQQPSKSIERSLSLKEINKLELLFSNHIKILRQKKLFIVDTNYHYTHFFGITNVLAKGVMEKDGTITIQPGSSIKLEESISFPKKAKKLKEELIKDKIIEKRGNHLVAITPIKGLSCSLSASLVAGTARSSGQNSGNCWREGQTPTSYLYDINETRR
ncbi:hypothetical protein [Dasania marina]|uniref:hypothetical protein n=1 Tax=Dasania marina TaxID=471499 RepID=UPI000378957B|nr:hypothetical protein [Dasania marina]